MATDKLKLAIFEALSPEYDAMIPDMPEHDFSLDFEKRINKLINRRNKPYYILINTVGKRVACIILAVVIAFAATDLSAEALRSAFRDFFVNMFEKYSIVQSAEVGDSPKTIEDIYEITYDLSGYTKDVWVDTEFDRRTEYTDGENYINFSQTVKSIFNERFNTEDAVLETVYVSDYEAIYYINNYGCGHLIWNNGEYIFVVSGNIGKTELIRAAESVQKAEN